MTYNSFDQICTAMGIGQGTPQTVLDEGPPELTARYRAAGGGFQASIVIEMASSPIHVTIYQTSWDDTVMLPGNDSPPDVPVGPHSLHLTAPTKRWFYVVESNGSLRSLYPDIGEEPTERTRKAMNDVFMPVLSRYLFS
jgi:hypothetical protein